MIPMMNIVAWSNVVPWGEQRQVEQDLIISRAIIGSFRRSVAARAAPVPWRHSAEQAAFPRSRPVLGRYRSGQNERWTNRSDTRPSPGKAGAVARAWQFQTKPGCAATQVSGASGGPGCPDTSESRDQHVGDRRLRCAASHSLPRGQSVVRWQCGNTNLLPRGDAGNQVARAASAQQRTRFVRPCSQPRRIRGPERSARGRVFRAIPSKIGDENLPRRGGTADVREAEQTPACLPICAPCSRRRKQRS